MKTILYETDLQVTECCVCNAPFAVPAIAIQRNRERKRESLWCPLCGARLHWDQKTDLQREKDKTAKLQRELQREKIMAGQLKLERDGARRSHQVMRQRIKNGVCPCCNRSFPNLLAHMQTKHPDFGHEKALRTIRELYGMTQWDLAKEIGISQGHISAFERKARLATWAKDQIEAWLVDQSN